MPRLSGSFWPRFRSRPSARNPPSTRAGFEPDGYEPTAGITALVDVMLDQLLSWAGALEHVRAEKQAAVA